ncbi:valyl-tRNA synthetase-like protein [Hortaea werneckii]|nr:valyl-tRNA synthetase-like protein [Hortaea werneckii]
MLLAVTETRGKYCQFTAQRRTPHWVSSRELKWSCTRRDFTHQQQLLFRAYRLLQLHLLEPRQALLVHTLLALQVLEMQLLLLPDLLANLLAQAAQHSLLLLDGIGGLGHLGLHLLNLLLCVDRTGQLQEHGNIGRDWIDHTSCRWALTGLEDEAVRYATHTLRTAEDDLVIVLALGVVHALVVLWVRCHDDRLRVVARPPWETLPQLLGQEGHEGVHHPQSIIKSCVQGIKSALLLGFGAVADDGFAVLNPEPRSHASQRGRSVVLRQVSKHELSSLVDLVAEVAVAAHDLHVEVDVAATSCVVDEGESEGIGTALVNAVWECLLLPLGCALDLFGGEVTNLQLVVKGTLPVIFKPNMIILATQKKRISQPVSNTEVGYSFSRSLVLLGQPRVEKGHRPDENHVIELWAVLHLHVECRYLVTPPELAGQTPIVNVLHPSSVLPLRALRLDLDGAVGHSVQCRLREWLHGHPPLWLQHWLNDIFALRAQRDHHLVVGLANEKPKLLEFSDNGVPDIKALLTFERTGIGVHGAVVVEDVDELKVVFLTTLEVIEVMCGCDLDRTSTEVLLDSVVAKDGKKALSKRMSHVLTQEMLHGLGTSSGNFDGLFSAVDRVLEVPDATKLDLLVIAWYVGKCGSETRTPVDESVRAVDEAFIVQLHKCLTDSCGKVLVHGEGLPRPIHRTTQPPQYLVDLDVVLLFPFPDSVYELLAAQVVPRQSVSPVVEHVLDDALRRDTCMIATRHVQHGQTFHTIPPDQSILQARCESMSNVESTRDVRRRDGYHERARLLDIAVLRELGVMETLLLPPIVPCTLDNRRDFTLSLLLLLAILVATILTRRIHAFRILLTGSGGECRDRPQSTSSQRKRRQMYRLVSVHEMITEIPLLRCWTRQTLPPNTETSKVRMAAVGQNISRLRHPRLRLGRRRELRVPGTPVLEPPPIEGHNKSARLLMPTR